MNSSYERCAHLYDLFDQKPNVEFFYHYAAQAKQVLDVGAGTGRIAIPLAERGVKVVCVEPSPAMRREFENKLARRPDVAANIRLIVGDARSFDAGATFPAAILSGSFDHFVDDEERRSSLANVRRHLVPGGTLVFDVFLGLMADSPLSPAGQVRVGEREIRRLVGGNMLPGGKRQTDIIFEVYEGDALVERIAEQGVVGVTSRRKVHEVLSRVGFEVRREWSSYEFDGFREGDPLLIVEAVRQN
jgi:SAM-dependent methyltransferase